MRLRVVFRHPATLLSCIALASISAINAQDGWTDWFLDTEGHANVSYRTQSGGATKLCLIEMRNEEGGAARTVYPLASVFIGDDNHQLAIGAPESGGGKWVVLGPLAHRSVTQFAISHCDEAKYIHIFRTSAERDRSLGK